MISVVDIRKKDIFSTLPTQLPPYKSSPHPYFPAHPTPLPRTSPTYAICVFSPVRLLFFGGLALKILNIQINA
jgi:hypothetical protein